MLKRENFDGQNLGEGNCHKNADFLSLHIIQFATLGLLFICLATLPKFLLRTITSAVIQFYQDPLELLSTIQNFAGIMDPMYIIFRIPQYRLTI